MLISSAIERLNNNFFSEDVLKLKLGPLNILWTNYISFLSPIFNTASDIVDFIKLFPAT
jgi:hypothetical protein